MFTPQEWQIECPHCGAVIGYTKRDVVEKEHDRGEWVTECKCPSCKSQIAVPCYPDDRTKVEEPERPCYNCKDREQ